MTNISMQRLPNVRSGNTPGIDYGASSVYRDNVPDNLQVTSIGASQLGVSNLTVSGSFNYTNIQASVITQTNQLQEYTAGAGIQLDNTMTVVGNLTTIKFPVYDNSGASITGYATVGSYDPTIANTLDFRNSSSGGFAFYNTNGLIASLTKNAANQGMITTDSIYPITNAVGVTINSAVIGDSTCVTAGSLRFHGGVLQYADISGTYNTISVGTTYVGGANINVAGGVISLNGNVSTTQVAASTILPNTLSFANTANGQINLATSNTYICSSSGVQSANLQVDGTAKMTITPSATGLWVGGSTMYPTYTALNAVVIGGSSPTTAGAIRYSGGALQFCDNTNTWQGLISSTFSGTFSATTLTATYSTAGTYGLQVVNNANSVLENLSSFLAPSLPDGAKSRIMIGRAETNYNAAYLDYNFVTGGSTSNSLGLGLVGFPSLVTVTAGTTTVTNALAVTLGTTIGGNLGVTGTLNAGASSFTSSSVTGNAATAVSSIINNATATGGVIITSTELAPNVATGQEVQSVIGKAQSAGNSALIRFRYTGDADPANNIAIGLFGASPALTVGTSAVTTNTVANATNGLNVTGAQLTVGAQGAQFNGVTAINNLLTMSYDPTSFGGVLVSLSNLGTSAVNTMANMFAPNLVDAQRIEYNLGQAASTNNAANIGFYRTTLGSANNYLGLGIYGTRDIVKIYPSQVAISQPVSMASTLGVTGASTLSTLGVTSTSTFTGLATFNGNAAVNGTDATTVMTITNNYSSGSSSPITALTVLTPNAISAQSSEILLGKSITTGNYASIRFSYQSDNSTLNNLTMGIGGNTITISPSQFYVMPPALFYNGINAYSGGLTVSSTAVFNAQANFNQLIKGSFDPSAYGGVYVALNNTGTNTVNTMANLLAPNITTSQRIEINLGQAATTSNCANIGYVQTATSATNYLGLGIYGTRDVLKVLSGQVATTQPLSVSAATLAAILQTTNTYAPGAGETVVGLSSQYASGVTAGKRARQTFGVNSSANNYGIIDFVYAGDGLTTNTLSLGFSSNTDILSITPIGVSTFSGRVVSTKFVGPSAGPVDGLVDFAMAAYTPSLASGTGLKLNLLQYGNTALVSGGTLATINFSGTYDTSTTNSAIGASIKTNATQTWTASANGSQLLFYTTPNSSVTQTKALTIDQDQSVAAASKISWNAGLATLTNSGTDPMIQAVNSLHINLNGSDQAIFNNGGTLYLKTIDALSGTGIVANNFVVSSTGKAATGGLRMNSTVLEYYNGTAWTSSGTSVTAGTNLSFAGSTLNVIAAPTFAGLVTSTGLSTSASSTTIATAQVYNTSTNTTVPTLWAIASGLTAGQRSIILHGAAGSTNNSGSLTFNYAGAGLTTNSVGIGVFNNDNLLTVDGSGNTVVTGNFTSNGTTKGTSATNATAPIIAQQNSSTAGTQYLQQNFAPSLPTASRAEIQYGVAAAANNCACIDFNYVASGSTANYIGLGFYGVNNVMTLTSAGMMTVPQITSTVANLTNLMMTNSSGSSPTINIVNNSTTSCTNAWFLSSTLGTGQNTSIYHGVSGTGSYNSAILQFNYTANGSSANNYGIGFFGANNAWSVNGVGNTVQGGKGQMSGLQGTSSSFFVQPSTGSTIQDFYVSSDTSNTTAFQITPIQNSAIYVKSKAASIPINFQAWISGIATTMFSVADTGVTADYLKIGTNKQSVTGGLATSGTNLQFNNGSAWQTVMTTAVSYPMYGCRVLVSNISGTITANIVAGSTLGGLTYSCAMGSSNTSVDVTIPGNINTNSNVQCNWYSTSFSSSSGFPAISPQISGGGTIIRFIPFATAFVTFWGSSYVIGTSGDTATFTFLAVGN